MNEATGHNENSASGTATLIADIRELHLKYPLSGSKRNALIELPDDQLAYLIALMKGGPATPPSLSPAQWNNLLELLKAHWIVPFFYTVIRGQSPDLYPPAETMKKMSAYYQSSLMETVRAEHQLKELLEAFRKAGVRALALKGTAISYAYYKDPACRPSSDIDLLLHPDDVVRARKALESAGYVCKERSFEISRKLYNEEAFTNPSRPRYKMVEIHWNLFISCDVDISRLFDRAISVRYGGLAFETLDPVDAIIYNGLHLLMHHDDDVRFSWIMDTALAARALPCPAGWQTLQERSKEYDATRSVQVTLAMARLWTGLALPSGFDDLSRWPQPGKKELAALAHLNLGRSELMMDKFRFQWYCASKPQEKLSLLAYFLFPPAEIMRNEYPGSVGWMMPLNYVRRWFSLAAKLTLHRGSARVNTK